MYSEFTDYHFKVIQVHLRRDQLDIRDRARVDMGMDRAACATTCMECEYVVNSLDRAFWMKLMCDDCHFWYTFFSEQVQHSKA